MDFDKMGAKRQKNSIFKVIKEKKPCQPGQFYCLYLAKTSFKNEGERESFLDK